MKSSSGSSTVKNILNSFGGFESDTPERGGSAQGLRSDGKPDTEWEVRHRSEFQMTHTATDEGPPDCCEGLCHR